MGLRDISVWGYSAAALALLCAGRDILKEKCTIYKFKGVRQHGNTQSNFGTASHKIWAMKRQKAISIFMFYLCTGSM